MNSRLAPPTSRMNKNDQNKAKKIWNKNLQCNFQNKWKQHNKLWRKCTRKMFFHLIASTTGAAADHIHTKNNLIIVINAFCMKFVFIFLWKWKWFQKIMFKIKGNKHIKCKDALNKNRPWYGQFVIAWKKNDKKNSTKLVSVTMMITLAR